MEINQTQERKVYNVTAQQDEWTVNASVVVNDGKVQNFDGSAFKKVGDGLEIASVTFNGYRNGEKLMRTVQNVSDDTAGVYGVVEGFVDAVIAKYEEE